MKIAVIGAMNEEITFLKTKMKNLKEEKVFHYDFFKYSVINPSKLPSITD